MSKINHRFAHNDHEEKGIASFSVLKLIMFLFLFSQELFDNDKGRVENTPPLGMRGRLGG